MNRPYRRKGPPPVATAEDLRRWRRLATVGRAVAERPQAFAALIKARNACRGRTLPASQMSLTSPLYLLFKRSELWGAWSGVQREAGAAELGRLARESLDALGPEASGDDGRADGVTQHRFRKDIDG